MEVALLRKSNKLGIMAILINKMMHKGMLLSIQNQNTPVCTGNNYGGLGAAKLELMGITRKVKHAPGLASLTFNAVTGSGLC